MIDSETGIEWLQTTSIKVPKHHRALNETAVKSLMESFEAIGQMQPITCYFDSETEATVLITGAHRLEAARRLGWDMIDGQWMDADDLDRELWEIDENLIRAELTDLERANHTARRAEIVKQKVEFAKLAKTKRDRSDSADKGQTDFVKETAAKTGKSKRGVGRDKRRGEKIIPEVKDAIKDMPAADSGVELDALASLEPDEQMQAVERVKTGASKDFRVAKDFIRGEEPSPSELEFERLKKAWQKAGGKAREQFLTWINQDYEKAAG